MNENRNLEDILSRDCCDFNRDLKTRVEILHLKCSLAEKQCEDKSLELSGIVEESIEIERELADCELIIKSVNERRKIVDIDIDKLKWMRERGSIVFESNCKRNELHKYTMDTIKREHLDLTTRAFKTVRQEAAEVMINTEINNLTDSKKELESKLRRLRKTKAENENYLAEASMELIAIKARAGAVIRLRNKLQESEALGLIAAKRLRDLKERKIAGGKANRHKTVD